MTTTAGQAEALNAILDQARRSGIPTSISDEHLVQLQHRWTNALTARLDHAIERAGSAAVLLDAVASAWRELAAEQPTLRLVLDTAEERSPALAEAMSTEFRFLALGGGLAGVDDPADEAIRLGRAFRDLVRGRAVGI